MIPSRYRGMEKTQKEVNAVLEQIKAEIKAEMRDYEGDNDFSMGVMYGMRYANTIIDMHINSGK